jgi:hypothetical protein
MVKMRLVRQVVRVVVVVVVVLRQVQVRLIKVLLAVLERPVK